MLTTCFDLELHS